MTIQFHLRVGDLLHNPKTGALGLIVNVTKSYFHFYLMSNSKSGDDFMVSMDRASKRQVYESIDTSVIFPYYGTNRRRRKRKIYIDIDEQL